VLLKNVVAHAVLCMSLTAALGPNRSAKANFVGTLRDKVLFTKSLLPPIMLLLRCVYYFHVALRWVAHFHDSCFISSRSFVLLAAILNAGWKHRTT